MSTTFYASNVISAIGGLTQSSQMSQSTGGTETSIAVTAPSSGVNTYIELLSQGGTPQAFRSLPAPTGKGWSAPLQGNTIPSGSWSSTFTLAKSGTSMSSASLIVRWYRRTIDGVYYPIGSSTLSSQTYSTTKTVYTPASVSASLWQFIAGDTLYVDGFVFNGSTAWASDVFTVYVSNSASAGVANDGTTTTPTMITTPTGLSNLIGASSFQTGVGYSVLNNSFTLADGLDQRSILTSTVEDTVGTLSFQRGQPVLFSDSNQGLLYSGYINNDTVTKIAAGGSPQTEHKLTCMDHHYDADKRANLTNYLNWTAGDIVCDQIQQTLSQENIIGAFALESDYTPAAFGQGTLTNAVATTTTSPFVYAPNTAQPPITSNTGDLEIATAGTTVTITESTTSDFSSGTLTNMTASSNSLSPTTVSGLCVQAQLSISVGSAGTEYASVKIWSGSMSVASNDTLNYDIWISSTSPAFNIAIDLGFSDGTFLSGMTSGSHDQNGLLPGPTTPQSGTTPAGAIDLSTYAKDTWYTRNITLATLSGKTINTVLVGLAGSTAGTYTVFMKNVYLGSQSGSPFFSTTATTPQVNPPVVLQAIGYIASLISTSVVQVYNPTTSSRVSTAHSIDATKLLRNSTVTWTTALPTVGTAGLPLTGKTAQSSAVAPSFVLFISYDNATWLPYEGTGTGGASTTTTGLATLPGLPAGANVAGMSLYLKETFSGGSDPSAIPSLLSMNITLTSAANTTTSDITAVYGNATQWNTGTLTNTAVNGSGQLVLGTVSRDWNDNLITNQTLYTSGGATQSAASGAYVMTVPGAAVGSGAVIEGLSRLDFVGTVADFTLDVDVQFSTSSGHQLAGITYRQTAWNTTIDTYAYNVLIDGGHIQLGYGSNGSSGAYTRLQLVTQSFPANTPIHIKLVVSGTYHQVFVQNSSTPIIALNDSTYTAPGYTGFSGQNNDTTSHTSTWDNLVVTPTLGGTWQSAAISLNSLGTCGNSQIAWAATQANGALSTTTYAQTSIDGGTTWQLATNGGAIPNLPSGTNVSGKNLLIKMILAGASKITSPTVIGLYARVCGNFGTVTGTRVSPALSLTPVGYVTSSNCMYNANIPTSCAVTVATSQDASTWTTVGNSGAGAALGYWTNQPSATQDLFVSNTSANYTNTSKSGGSVSTVTYDTTNSRITLSGGSGGLYLNSSVSAADVDLLCDMDESDAGGLVWQYQNTSNYYELGVYDASSSGGFTNQLRLYVVSSGTRFLKTGAATITFTRGTFHRVRVTMQGLLINVYFDGVCMISYLDGSSFGAGLVGLRNDGGTSRYYQLWVQPLGTNLSGQTLYTKVTMTTSDPAQMPQLFTLVACVRGSSIATGATVSQLHPVTTPFAAYISNEMDTLVQASGDYYWYIDKWKQLHFGPRLARPAAFPVQSVVDPAGASGYLLYQPQVSVLSAADLYRNQQIVTDVTSLVTPPAEIKVADGSTTSWQMGYPLYSAPTITINGSGATVGVQGIDSGRQFYWQPGSPSISYDSTLPKLPDGTVLSFTYVGQSTVNVPLNNTGNQTTQAALELNSGIVAEIESALRSTTRGMTTSQATTFGNGLLTRYGNNGTIELIGTTMYTGLVPGTVIGLFLPELMSTWNAQLPIVKLTTTGRQGQNGIIWEYSVDATNGPNLSNWAHVWF